MSTARKSNEQALLDPLGEFAKASSMKKLDAASWVPDEPERTVAAFISSIARKWA
jgi:hypothetical protein